VNSDPTLLLSKFHSCQNEVLSPDKNPQKSWKEISRSNCQHIPHVFQRCEWKLI